MRVRSRRYGERLSVFHRLVWGTGLSDDTLALAVPNARVAPPSDSALPPLARRPAPAVPAQLLPERISASGYNSLVACPYQYYGRYVLGLRETDEVREEMEKRDYGEFVHRILRRMHGRFPLFGSVPRAELERGMHEISESVFREATETSYLSKAWALRWQMESVCCVCTRL